MNAYLRIFLIAMSFFFLAYVLQMVRRDRFLLRYSFAWVVLGILGVIAAIAPDAVIIVSTAIGFEASSSFLFLVCILFLMITSLLFIAALSHQSKMIERLVQEVSLLKMEFASDVKRGDEQIKCNGIATQSHNEDDNSYD